MFKTIDIIFSISMALSIVWTILSLVFAVRYHKTQPRARRVVSALQMFTIGIFIAVLFQYLPIYYSTYDFGDSYKVLRPFILSVFQSLRVFILDADYDIVSSALEDCNSFIRVGYAAYCVLFFLIAPVLTAGFILSLFNDFTAEFRYKFSKRKPIYILSKLNEKSLALAKSIRLNADAKNEKISIVFADVYKQNDEDDYEMLCEAQDREINAICLKRDITHLNLDSKKGKVELFLIDDDESENMKHAIRLTELYKTRPRTKIFVHATSVGSAYIVDSLDKGDLVLANELKEKIKKDPEAVLAKGLDALRNEHNRTEPILDGGFRILRVDSVHSLVLNTLKDSNLFEICRQCKEEETDNVISLLIVGMGDHGKQILKTALWYCQLEGYRLEINVVDKGMTEYGVKRNIKKILKQECPEMISRNKKYVEGDANYDIEFFKDVDCFSEDFVELFDLEEEREIAERLKKTKMAFVALGDDDKNIEAAIMLRKLFDRLNGIHDKNIGNRKNNPNELPIIYSIVYDDKKTENLNVNKNVKNDNYLINHKSIPYHIRFIGNLSSQYSYDAIMKEQMLEEKAFFYHLEWVRIEKKIRDEIEKPQNAEVLKLIREEEGLEAGEPLIWYDGDYYDEKGKVVATQLISQLELYLKFEYFRNSSIARAIHKTAIEHELQDVFTCETPTNGFLCRCKMCESRRITEHKRWNAYMRANGYIYGEKRAERGMVHPDIKIWDKLTMKSKYKD